MGKSTISMAIFDSYVTKNTRGYIIIYPPKWFVNSITSSFIPRKWLAECPFCLVMSNVSSFSSPLSLLQSPLLIANPPFHMRKHPFFPEGPRALGPKLSHHLMATGHVRKEANASSRCLVDSDGRNVRKNNGFHDPG